jgi:hypothetical protein
MVSKFDGFENFLLFEVKIDKLAYNLKRKILKHNLLPDIDPMV